MKKIYYLVSGDHISKIINSVDDDCRMYNEGGQWTSRSSGSPSLEELKINQEILDKPCVRCNSIIGTTYHEPTKSELIKKNICFFCNFWEDKLKIVNNKNVARIKGSHYTISPDQPGNYSQGFGGREFHIKFNDGRLVTTKNMWHQGDIPEHFKKDLPDNAIFVEHPLKAVHDKLYDILFNKN